MKKFTIFCAFFSLLAVFSLAWADDHMGEYKILCKEIIDLVTVAGEPDTNKILAKADKLIHIGVEIATEHGSEEAICKPIIDVFASEAENMKTVTMEKMEELYHDAGILAQKGVNIDPDDDKYEECMEKTHLITHPGTVPVLINAYKKDHNKKHLNTLKEELATLYEHLSEHEGH